MKIAVLGTRGFPDVQGGIESHCQHLYPLLAARGCEVVVFARRPYVRSAAVYKNVRVRPLPCIRQKYFEAFSHSVIGVFAAVKEKPDILHVHGVGPALVIPLARVLGLTVVLTHHGADYERKKWNAFSKFILRLGERFGVRYAHSVICVSDTIARHVKNAYGRETRVIPNGAVVLPPSESRKALEQYGLIKEKYILAVGRFVPEKGFHDLIAAFNAIGPMPWKLAIVGKADHYDAYSRRLEQEARTNKNIVFTGLLGNESLRELYSHAGLFVLPSYHEGMSIALLEALSYGLPVAASDIPQNREILGDAAAYFQAGNVTGLARAVSALMIRGISPEEKTRQIGRVQQQYAWQAIADQTLAVYTSLGSASDFI